MQIAIYILSLLLSSFLYFLFAAYMTVAAGVSSMPINNFFCAILIFGFASWFHLFRPKSGSIILGALIIISFITLPLPLMFDYFDGGEYTPSIFEFTIPLVLSLAIFGLILFRKGELKNLWLKIGLACVPFALGIYAGGHFLYRILF